MWWHFKELSPVPVVFQVELGCSAAPTEPPGPSGVQTQWVQRFADEMCHLVARQRVIVNLKTKQKRT